MGWGYLRFALSEVFEVLGESSYIQFLPGELSSPRPTQVPPTDVLNSLFYDRFLAICFSVCMWTHLGAIWVPSGCHLEAISGHLGVILADFRVAKEEGGRNMKRKSRGLRNSRKYARRLGESTIFEFPGDHVEAFLGSFWGHLGVIEVQVTLR